MPKAKLQVCPRKTIRTEGTFRHQEFVPDALPKAKAQRRVIKETSNFRNKTNNPHKKKPNETTRNPDNLGIAQRKGPDPEAYRDVTHNKGYKNNKK